MAIMKGTVNGVAGKKKQFVSGFGGNYLLVHNTGKSDVTISDIVDVAPISIVIAAGDSALVNVRGHVFCEGASSIDWEAYTPPDAIHE